MGCVPSCLSNDTVRPQNQSVRVKTENAIREVTPNAVVVATPGASIKESYKSADTEVNVSTENRKTKKTEEFQAFAPRKSDMNGHRAEGKQMGLCRPDAFHTESSRIERPATAPGPVTHKHDGHDGGGVLPGIKSAWADDSQRRVNDANDSLRSSESQRPSCPKEEEKRGGGGGGGEEKEERGGREEEHRGRGEEKEQRGGGEEKEQRGEGEEKENRIKQLEAILEQQRSNFENALLDKNAELRRLQAQDASQKAEIASLSNRLSREMHWRVAADETSLENVNVKARPMTLADDFRLLCSDVWLRTIDLLEEKYAHRYSDEDSRYNLLCDIMLITERACTTAKSFVFDLLAQATGNPLVVFKECLEPRGKKKSSHLRLRKFKYPSDPPRTLNNKVQEEITSNLRHVIGKMEMRYLVQFVEREVSKNFSDIKVQEELKEYTKELTIFCWKMIFQQPPMSFDVSCKGQGWTRKSHPKLEPHFGSVLKPPARIDYYVFPSLMHGGQTMVQGKVMVRGVTV